MGSHHQSLHSLSRYGVERKKGRVSAITGKDPKTSMKLTLSINRRRYSKIAVGEYNLEPDQPLQISSELSEVSGRYELGEDAVGWGQSTRSEIRNRSTCVDKEAAQVAAVIPGGLVGSKPTLFGSGCLVGLSVYYGRDLTYLQLFR